MGVRAEYPNIPQFDWHPTGRLTLTVGSWPSRKWNDTERSLIDSRLSGIFAAIVGLAEAKRANEEEEEERRRRTYDEALAVYETQVRARNDERHQLRALFRDASRLQRADRLREFIAAVEDRARQDDLLTFERIAVSGIARRSGPHADICVDLWAGPACDPTLLSGNPYPRRQTGIAADCSDQSR